MKTVQSSEMKAKLPEYLDAVERGESIVVTRHGRPVAHLVPAPGAHEVRVRHALEGISALRRATKKMSAKDILAARHEGHRR